MLLLNIIIRFLGPFEQMTEVSGPEYPDRFDIWNYMALNSSFLQMYDNATSEGMLDDFIAAQL